MATRAIYSFKDEVGTFHVYKHWDGYPQGAYLFIRKALGFAFDDGQTFEAAEFAAAFIRANKTSKGDVCIASVDEGEDIAYFYEITSINGVLHVKCWRRENRDDPIFIGTLDEMYNFAVSWRATDMN